MDNRPIGVFDSGIGGLTVVDAITKSLPNESILYVGDTARVPYGNKSKARVQEFSYDIAHWLKEQKCKMIVVACNTASSLALDYLKSNFDLPIIGVISPGVVKALKVTQTNAVGVLGTYGTIRSDAYGKRLKSANSKISVLSQACPLFVPLAEEGWVEGDVPKSVATHYLKQFKSTTIDTVILGCTHYPLLKQIIGDVLGSTVNLVDSGEATVSSLQSVLTENNLFADESSGEIHCFVTDSPDTFESLASRFVNGKIQSISHIDLT
jgi:glutamate racemase